MTKRSAGKAKKLSGDKLLREIIEETVGKTPIHRIIKRMEKSDERYRREKAWVELFRLGKSPKEVYKEIGPESKVYEGITRMLRWKKEIGDKGLAKKLKEVGVEDKGERGRIMFKLDALEKSYNLFLEKRDEEIDRKAKKKV